MKMRTIIRRALFVAAVFGWLAIAAALAVSAGPR
jgi:hypothetical protein